MYKEQGQCSAPLPTQGEHEQYSWATFHISCHFLTEFMRLWKRASTFAVRWRALSTQN